MTEIQQVRAQELLRAQENARRLFEAIEAEGLIRSGITEGALNAEIYALAGKMFGISKYWHKRIVRAGRNTLAPYDENPPDLTIGDDDVLFLDLGPVFEEWEADFGRTFVLGADPVKHRLRQDVGAAFAAGKKHFHAHPEIRANELFQYAVELAEGGGWEFGGRIAGHLIGSFRTSGFPRTRSRCMSIRRITTGCASRMRTASCGTGFWRFISWIGQGGSADFMRSCLRFEGLFLKLLQE